MLPYSKNRTRNFSIKKFCYRQITESEACHLQRRFSHRKVCLLWQAPDSVKTTLNSCDIDKQIESIEKRLSSQDHELFQHERNVLYALCWTISYFSNHAITYICNKDAFTLYLWSLWWRVFRKFLVFLFKSEKRYVLKYQK